MATMTEPKAENKTLVHFMVEGGVAIIELDDAPANTYTYEMMRQLDEAILRARFDDDVHVVVLRGHGDKFFSAGANIGMLNSVTPRFKFFFCLHANETLNRLEQTPKLTIAALNGHTVGGGLEIAMACDIRLAKENAGKIGLPEVNLGVLPGTGGTQRLARIVGKPRAIEMMVKGETFSFDKAKELGLVNEVFAADDFWEQAMLYAKQFTPPHKASRAGADQTVRPIGRRGAVRVGADARARAAAAAVPVRGREGGDRGVRREACGGVQGPVKTDLLIGNEWRSAAKRYCLTNPATEEPLAEVAEAGEEEINAAGEGARARLHPQEGGGAPARPPGPPPGSPPPPPG